MALPPLLAGALKLTLAEVSPGVATTLVGAPGTLTVNSKAPISQDAPCGRVPPRWSVVSAAPAALVQLAVGTALSAGLGESKAWVWVGPPLLASGPRFGSCPVTLPVRSPVMAQFAVFSIRLWPC